MLNRSSYSTEMASTVKPAGSALLEAISEMKMIRTEICLLFHQRNMQSLIDAVTDLDKLKDVDWCTVLYEKLKTSINDWKEASKSAPKTRTVTGCVYLLLILFLDFIKKAKNLDRNPLDIPRTCQYSHAKIKQVLGDMEYDKFDFKCLERYLLCKQINDTRPRVRERDGSDG
ncbi:uncharacterized protein [Miscanthus floridulus]|uniref:uncharacterized protein isoform X2 n=1 Tax=Miscanthus floridulus TaxID=154761 RepID=UPI003457B583